jgi:hypothetical protein
MALVYQTGRDLTLTINSVTYIDVAAGATLAVEENQFTGEVISGRFTKHIDRSGTLTVELYQDWSSTSPASVCKALWSAAATSPNTSLSFTLGVSGTTIAGKVFPNFPEMGGNATDALTTSVTLAIDFTGANTLTLT